MVDKLRKTDGLNLLAMRKIARFRDRSMMMIMDTFGQLYTSKSISTITEASCNFQNPPCGLLLTAGFLPAPHSPILHPELRSRREEGEGESGQRNTPEGRVRRSDRDAEGRDTVCCEQARATREAESE